MSKKQSIAARKRMKDIHPELLSEKMRKLALKRQKMFTSEERKAHSRKMLAAREAKRAIS